MMHRKNPAKKKLGSCGVICLAKLEALSASRVMSLEFRVSSRIYRMTNEKGGGIPFGAFPNTPCHLKKTLR
jgi:hypothetical protein